MLCVFSLQMLEEKDKTGVKLETAQDRYQRMADRLNRDFFQKQPSLYSQKDWKDVQIKCKELQRKLGSQLRGRTNI